jgi:hypothetical protein
MTAREIEREVENIWWELKEYCLNGYLSRDEFDQMDIDQAWEWLKNMEASF